jgi:hypothetical protein
MMPNENLPLLLVDNSSMYVVGKGTYKVESISFDEAKGIIDVFNTEDILKCYTDRAIDQVIYEYCGIEKREFEYKRIRAMRPGQVAIAFKEYITPSETQPVVEPEPGVEAKKIQNIYVYCESITRLT